MRRYLLPYKEIESSKYSRDRGEIKQWYRIEYGTGNYYCRIWLDSISNKYYNCASKFGFDILLEAQDATDRWLITDNHLNQNLYYFIKNEDEFRNKLAVLL